jgi:hypothetical protein
MFLDEVKDKKLQLILAVHAANLVNDLKCTGLLEDDPESDFVLPSDWKKDVEGVFSFRYQDTTGTIYFFKFVTEGSTIDVNAISSKAKDQLFSFEIKLDDFPNLDAKEIDTLAEKYKKELLAKLVPKIKESEEQKQSSFKGRGGIYPDEDPNLYGRPVFTNPTQNPFGDYGKSDLWPNIGGPYDTKSGGNLVGPTNKIFQGGPDQPKIRFDPFGPGSYDPDPDPDIFMPQNPMKKGPFGGGPFGGGNKGPFGGGGGFGGGFGGGGYGGPGGFI